MALSDSIFLFEIVVEELNSYINCKEFYIKLQFADVFTLSLKDPNEVNLLLPKRKSKKGLIGKTKVRHPKLNKKSPIDSMKKTRQSVLFVYNVDLLISRMKTYQMELSVWHKDYLEERVGSTHIPWSYIFINFLNKLHKKEELFNVSSSGEYSIFDEVSSKQMASIKLNIKLTYLKDKISTEFRSLSDGNQQTFMYTGFNSKSTTILSTAKENSATPVNILKETGVIKTLYRNRYKKIKKTTPIKCIDVKKDNFKEKDTPINDISEEKIKQNDYRCQSIKSIISSIRSNTDIEICKQTDLIKSKSCTSVNREKYNILNYIFSGSNGPYGNKVYCVGYFTVDNDFTKDSESPQPSINKLSSEEKSEESQERYNFKICDSECRSKKDADNTCSLNACSLNLPAEAASLISITKCKRVECENKKHTEVATPPDDCIFLGMSNINKECCSNTEKVEEVVGEMKAKIKFDGQPCFCACECTFGFTKKTTYCSVCRGYEITGDDLPAKPIEDNSFPCPIFHKLIDKNKLKTWSTSGSEIKKKPEDSQKNFKASKSMGSDKRSVGANKSVESEKESKKKKKE